MLKRPATVITLTPEDILMYDESVQERSPLQNIDRHQEQAKQEIPKDLHLGDQKNTAYGTN